MQDQAGPECGGSFREVQDPEFSRTRPAQLKSLGSRRRHACDRCRRQKLKCDVEKPCSLCLRSGFACETTSAPLRNYLFTTYRKSKRSTKAMEERRKIVQHVQSDMPETSRASPRGLDTPRGSLNVARSCSNIPSDTDIQPDIPQQPPRHAQASAVELTDELFHLHGQGSINSPTTYNNTSALPGGTSVDSPYLATGQMMGKTSLSSHFPGLCLPSRPVCDFLLQSYWRSVHWFMMLFYKPSFEREYRQIVDNQYVTARQKGTAVLILMVLAIGARYASDDQRSKVGISKEELSSLQRDMLNQIRLHYFEVLDSGGVECVQLCILLSTYYLYNGKPNLALPILGAGVHSAQAQGLHKESLWGPATEIVLEVRKRTWWALYVLDRFASITYGRPSSINDVYCAVSMPRDMDDILAAHPLLNMIESPASNSSARVTLGSYQRHKFDLYSIATAVIGNIHNVNVSGSEAAMNQAAEINTKLVDWFDRLPEELRLEHNADLAMGSLTSAEVEICQLFQLQALALQLAYDNIQIILHRPFIRCTRRLPVSSGLRDSDARPTSFEQCRHCARRTCSILPRYAKVVYAAQNTHAVAYIAMQNFTAGVTLAMVALSDPGSEQAIDAKRGVANSISLQQTIAASSIVPSQTVSVLKGLFQLMFRHEMESLLVNSPRFLNSPSPTDGPPNHAREADDLQASDRMHFSTNHRFDRTLSGGSQEDSELPSSIIGTDDRSQLSLSGQAAMNLDLSQDIPISSFHSGIDQALESVHQVLWENYHPIVHPGAYVPETSGPQADICGRARPSVAAVAEENNRLSLTNPLTSLADPASQGLNTVNDSFLGQSWVWNQPD
ncbi:hypothetical protein N7532_006090 [Penicillium argentinense]|uniref:Zn(2)-C6 fungal-type domain-containing protein n=1 Tax=Penicillium argentinense TaxID=1131581 RepID=A0A9W9KAF0_9EURO|nr:uncharacterized protein N7532_006090 [Penicillium argentinense]KAJ5099089.1 hypothetical protein N7532_006090 [Penicillium argentinense]